MEWRRVHPVHPTNIRKALVQPTTNICSSRSCTFSPIQIVCYITVAYFATQPTPLVFIVVYKIGYNSISTVSISNYVRLVFNERIKRKWENIWVREPLTSERICNWAMGWKRAASLTTSSTSTSEARGSLPLPRDPEPNSDPNPNP